MPRRGFAAGEMRERSSKTVGVVLVECRDLKLGCAGLLVGSNHNSHPWLYYWHGSTALLG